MGNNEKNELLLPCKPCNCGLSLMAEEPESRSGSAVLQNRMTFTGVLRGALGMVIAAGEKGSWEQLPALPEPAALSGSTAGTQVNPECESTPECPCKEAWEHWVSLYGSSAPHLLGDGVLLIPVGFNTEMLISVKVFFWLLTPRSYAMDLVDLGAAC